MSRQWSRSELAQQLRHEIMGYFGAASAFDEKVAKKLKLSRTDMRCLDLIARLGPLTAGRLAEESGLTTGAVTFILDRLEEAGMVTRRRDTEDRRRVWVEVVPEAQQRMTRLQQPVADEMRAVAQRFKADELEIVRDFMRQAKEVFQHQVRDAVHDAVHEAVHGVRGAPHNISGDITGDISGDVHGATQAGGDRADATQARREGPPGGK